MSTTQGDPNALPPPPRSAVIDKTGAMTSAWLIWFQKLVQRVGGPYSDNVTTIVTNMTALTGRVTAAETHLGVIDGQITTLNGQVSTLQGQVYDLNTRVTAIEAKLAAGQSVAITTAALTPGGTQGSMTFTNGILTGQVQAT